LKRRLQTRTAPRQQATRADDRGDTSTDLIEFRYGWIAPAAAMRHLGVRSLSALYRLINEHRLPYGRIGRRYRFQRHQLDEWAMAHTQALRLVRGA
jgi:excisionase family DNA binding protein